VRFQRFSSGTVVTKILSEIVLVLARTCYNGAEIIARSLCFGFPPRGSPFVPEPKKRMVPKGRYTDHVAFLAIFHPPRWFYVVFRETRPSPTQKKTRGIFEKKKVFTGRLFASQKNTFPNYLPYFMKEIRYNLGGIPCGVAG